MIRSNETFLFIKGAKRLEVSSRVTNNCISVPPSDLQLLSPCLPVRPRFFRPLQEQTQSQRHHHQHKLSTEEYGKDELAVPRTAIPPELAFPFFNNEIVIIINGDYFA